MIATDARIDADALMNAEPAAKIATSVDDTTQLTEEYLFMTDTDKVSAPTRHYLHIFKDGSELHWIGHVGHACNGLIFESLREEARRQLHASQAAREISR